MAKLLTRIKNNPLHFFLLVLTSPVIYGLLIPIVISDLCGTLYQNICFRVYKIPLVKRSDYVVLDRVKLKQLTLFQKINCLYCEYANGIVAYTGEIIARTEWYWCPIKHNSDLKYAHDHYHQFVEYNDTDNYRGKLKELRKKCRACETGCTTKTS